MNRIYLAIVIFSIFVINNTANAQKNNYQVVAVGFYNLENLFDTVDDTTNKGDDEFLPGGSYRYTDDIYHQKLRNLATVLKQLGTDLTPDGPAIIGCAEVENKQVLLDLAAREELKGRNYQVVHFNSPDERGIDVGFLYNPKYFTLLNARNLKVNLAGTGDKETTRDVLFVSGILAGDTIHVLVNHWPSRRGGEAASAPKRAKAAAVGKHIIDSLQSLNPKAKIFLMGDLNDDPVSASVAVVIGAKEDKSAVKENGMFNPWIKFYKEGYGSLAYDDKWNLFDQIILSGGLLQKDSNHWRYYKAEVFNRDFLKSQFGQYKGYPLRSFEGSKWLNGYSDHFPTVVYLIKG